MPEECQKASVTSLTGTHGKRTMHHNPAIMGCSYTVCTAVHCVETMDQHLRHVAEAFLHYFRVAATVVLRKAQRSTRAIRGAACCTQVVPAEGQHPSDTAVRSFTQHTLVG